MIGIILNFVLVMRCVILIVEYVCGVIGFVMILEILLVKVMKMMSWFCKYLLVYFLWVNCVFKFSIVEVVNFLGLFEVL